MVRIRDVMIEKGIKRRESVGPASHGEVRGVLRNDMVRALAHALPIGTLRLGSQIVSVKRDEATSFPIVHLRNGQDIKAKVSLPTIWYIVICYCSMIGSWIFYYSYCLLDSDVIESLDRIYFIFSMHLLKATCPA